MNVDVSSVDVPGFVGPYLALFVTAIAYENVAILAAAYLIIEHEASALPVTLIVLTGIVTGDWLIYGLGAAARHFPVVRRWLGGERAIRSRRWLDDHLLTLVIAARLFPGPGVLFPTFAAFGGLGIPFWRFARATVITAAFYTPLVLLLVVSFGSAVATRVGWSARVFLVAALVVAAAGPWTQRLSRWIWALLEQIHLDASAVRWLGQFTHRGMPRLADLRAHGSIAEHIPPPLFYVPLVLQWIGLGVRYRSFTLPTIANPNIELAGLLGESKVSYLDQIQGEERKWLAPYLSLVRGPNVPAAADVKAALFQMSEVGLHFPIVAKPDIGWRGYGVRLIQDADELNTYVDGFPRGARLILQKTIDYDGEAGVFYLRQPDEPHGRVPSLTLRYFPFVVGDGHSTVRELVDKEPRANWKAQLHLGMRSQHRGFASEQLDQVPAAGEIFRLAFIGSNRVGGLYRDASAYITPELERCFDTISRAMPEFYIGRYDIRFASIDRLQQGQDFAIIEINGAGAEAIHVWDPNMGLGEVYRTLFTYQETLFQISAKNRDRGFTPASMSQLLRAIRKQNALIRRYPPSS
ncbi:VTT domain-containing protein [Mesorhizobium huakuii]|uniref:VTT domain-containing protein n=1 Tax=Mesorhizobium huakuii TaxID=28104 RepID=UPI0024E0B82E|nr:VTT domain-containing protein [Mesorhizobium huakuii]